MPRARSCGVGVRAFAAAAHNQRALVVLISGYISYQQLFLPGAQFKKNLVERAGGGGIGKKIQNFDHKTTTSKHLPPLLPVDNRPACMFQVSYIFCCPPLSLPLPSTWSNSATTFYLYYKVCSTTSACEMQCKFI